MEYARRLYAKKIKRGSKYQYTQVIQFNLNNFAFVENDKIVDTYYIQNEEGILLNDKLIFVQIYIPNLRKKWYTSGVENLSEAERYLLTLIEPEVETVVELGKGDELMEEYIDEAVEVSDDFLGEAYDKECALKDLEHREGEQKAKAEIVKRMSQKYEIDSIVEITGLSKEEVEEYITSER